MTPIRPLSPKNQSISRKVDVVLFILEEEKSFQRFMGSFQVRVLIEPLKKDMLYSLSES
jgi:hypothetical protein